MLGHKSGFQGRVRCVAPECTFVHCMLHREALAAKTMPHQLRKVLKQVIKLANFVKGSALNTRLFRRLCEDTNAEHCELLYNTEARWLSKGNVLKRIFELRDDLVDFFKQQRKEELAQFLQDEDLALAYLVDIFSRLNALNTSMQGKDKTIIDFLDLLSAFIATLDL